MAAAWARGEQITVEEILKQYPGLSTEKAVRLVYEEVCLRREAGEQVVTAEVMTRFPSGKMNSNCSLAVIACCGHFPGLRISPKLVSSSVHFACFPS